MNNPTFVRAIVLGRHLGLSLTWLAWACAGHVTQTSLAQQPDLAERARTAKNDYHPITAEQVSAARATALKSANNLQLWLKTNDDGGTKWKQYLHWENLPEALETESKSNLAKLSVVYRQLNTDEPGLERAAFRRLAKSLRRYIDLASAAGKKNLKNQYTKVTQGLASDLSAYAEHPTPRLEYSIGRRLGFIHGLGLSPELHAAVRDRHGLPNAIIDVSEKFLSAAVSGNIDEVGDVRDTILGTAIRGTSQTNGSVKLQLIPATDRAIMEVSSTGEIVSKNLGYNGPIVIRSTGFTDFTASKRVEFTDRAFRIMPSVADATTRTEIHNVRAKNSGPFSRLISQVGGQRVQESKRRAEAIASRHAERDIRIEFDKELTEEVKGLRRQYRDVFRYPLLRKGAFPEHVRFSSTTDVASIEVIQAKNDELAASGPPPPINGKNDLRARIQQTAASNYVTTLLSGATLSESTAGGGGQLDRKIPQWLEDLLGDLDVPDNEQDKETAADATTSAKPSDRPWSITFRRKRPVSVEFSDGQIKLAVHTARIVSAGDRFDGWDLLVSYKMDPQNGGLLLTRSGDVDVLPTNFDPATGRGLSTRQVGLRSNLIKVINDLTNQGDGFPKTLEMPMIELAGELADVGTLALEGSKSENGWLTLTWNLP